MADSASEERETKDGKKAFKGQSSPVESSGVLDDLDCRVYGYSDVSPTDLLDLHCKAVLGIEKGVVPLPKYKTLKLGCQLQGTDLYLTMLYSRDALWVPGDGFTHGSAIFSEKTSDPEETVGSGDKSAPTPRKRTAASTSTSSKGASSKPGTASKGKQAERDPDADKAGKTYTTDHWLRFSGSTPLAVRTTFDPTLAAKGKETRFDNPP